MLRLKLIETVGFLHECDWNETKAQPTELEMRFLGNTWSMHVAKGYVLPK